MTQKTPPQYVTPAPNQGPPPPAPRILALPNALPNDLLHHTAYADPLYAQAADKEPLAIKHPLLARKYGIIRGNTHLQLRASDNTWQPPTPTLSEAPPWSAPAADDRAPPAPAVPSAPSKEEEDDAPDLGSVNDLDLARIREMMWADMLNNPEQRQLIEKRLAPLDKGAAIRDMLTGKMVQQRVPIVPDVFEPVYSQLPFWVEQKLQERMVRLLGNLDTNKPHIGDRYAFWGLVCSIVELGGKPLGTVYSADLKDLDDAKFRAKEQVLVGLPVELIASLGVHYMYFSIRMRSLFQLQDIKNG